MSIGLPSTGSAVPTLLEQLGNSVARLEQSVSNLHVSISYSPTPGLARESKELGVASEKLLILQKLIERIDYVSDAIDDASANMHKF